jgi:DNA-directed RNA polymerase specialized sigma24 family protein
MNFQKPVLQIRPEPSITDDGRSLVRAVIRLPTNLRDVFLLHRMAGMTYDEIGARLGLDTEKVQARLASALIRLGRALEPDT